MKHPSKVLILLALAVTTSSVALASEGPSQAVAYINRDTGAATENPNVKEGSSCESPDRKDRQSLSEEGGSERNVHVDACLFDENGEDFDGTVTFESKGAGAVSACPDPDQVVTGVPQVMNGEKLAYVHDHNGDGRNDHCHQTGYQTKDSAGDDEYHVRLNNDSKKGLQRVVFCHDPQQDPAADASGQPEGHGCSDTDSRSKVRIRWVK